MLEREDWMMIQEKRVQGVYIKNIAAELGVHPKTVSRALARSAAPPGKRPRTRRSKLDPFKALVGRWAARARGVVRGGHSSRASGTRLRGQVDDCEGLHPAEACAAPIAGGGTLRDRARGIAAGRLGQCADGGRRSQTSGNISVSSTMTVPFS